MTCIVGIVNGSNVIIGGDRRGVGSDFSKDERIDKKVFKKGEFVFGFTSSYRMGQLIRYKLSLPTILEGQDVMEYMVVNVVDSIRKVLNDGGYTEVKNNVEQGGHLLVGFRGRLFHIQSDFQVSESITKYDSTGCGEYYALGAMKTLIDLGYSDPINILESGLKAAHYFSAGVGGDFDFVETNESPKILVDNKEVKGS